MPASEFKKFRYRRVYEFRPFVPGTHEVEVRERGVLTKVQVANDDLHNVAIPEGIVPKLGDMIGRDIDTTYEWLLQKEEFESLYEPL